MEFVSQGRGLARRASSVSRWMKRPSAGPRWLMPMPAKPSSTACQTNSRAARPWIRMSAARAGGGRLNDDGDPPEVDPNPMMLDRAAWARLLSQGLGAHTPLGTDVPSLDAR